MSQLTQSPEDILQEDLDFNKRLFINYVNSPNDKLDYLKLYKKINLKKSPSL